MDSIYAQLPAPVLALMTPVRVALGAFGRESSLAMVQELRNRVAREGKFRKLAVFYLPVSLIPPAAWFYDCSECQFYLEERRQCELVEGDIEPYAWCGLWVNRGEDLPLSWVERAIT